MTYDYLLSKVKHRQNLTPSMIRIVLGGEDLQRFESSGGPDEFVWLSFPSEDSDDGKGRYYTVRHWDSARAEMTIDFVKHDTGIATTWAQHAKPGDEIRLLSPRFRFKPPSDCAYIILVADFTGLPAIARILEENSQDITIIAHVEVPTIDDRQGIEISPDADLHWHVTPRNGLQSTQLLKIARSVRLPPGPGYIWIAGEATAVSQSRKYFRDVMGVSKDRLTSVGYWIEGQARV
jgi:NADPH-dependent ferric siderophore reductase